MHKNTIKNATLLVVRIFININKSTPLSTGVFVYGLFLFALRKCLTIPTTEKTTAKNNNVKHIIR